MRPRGDYVAARAIVVHDSQISTPCAALEAKWCFAHEASADGERKRKFGRAQGIKGLCICGERVSRANHIPGPEGV